MRQHLHRGLLLALCLLGFGLYAGAAAGPDLEQERVAAAAGDPAALVRLAERYETGDGVPFDLGTASALLELAAERGDALAQYRLGLLQAGGLVADADPAEAYGWLRLAAQSGGDDAPSALLAGALGDALAERLDEAALERVEQRVAAFQPVEGPAELPTIDGASAPGGDPASLAAVLPPLGCGAPTTASGGDGVVTLLAYAPSGSITDAAITPDVRADLARRGAALDIEELSPAICAIRAVTAKAGQDEAAGVSLAGVADDARAVLYDGEKLVVDVAPAYEPRYVAVDYVVHTGQVWHLHPARGDDGHLPAGQALRLGDGSSGPAWQVGAPFGEDLILVTVARTPFGADRQPADEPVEAYRTRLEQRLHGSSGAPVQVFARIVETRAR